MKYTSEVIIRDPIEIKSCEGFWSCVTPADWLTALLTFIAIIIPVSVTLIVEKKKRENEVLRRVEEERKPLKRELVLSRKRINKLINNLEEGKKHQKPKDQLFKLRDENNKLLNILGDILLDHKLIRTDEIDRMRIFYGALLTANDMLTLKAVSKVQSEFKQFHKPEDFKDYVEGCIETWDRIKNDYNIKD
ncbi:hypothetical protein [Halobacillus sp. A5]|uniref:hypothetical protein n=1 Tax=Halobacillus sp. A5 TaxID=2880263 RepID=UPI0020A66FD5|nr:hypothetical protein [Halobacillus sp. A5]MCP3026626.1 hypothetical protein [Halobacillus sp. A5]